MKLLFTFALFATVSYAQAGDPLGGAYAPSIDTNCAHSQYASNIWLTNTMQKIRQDSGSPASNACYLTVYSTQNEFADFQVHFHDTGSGTANLSVTVSNFVQSAPSSFTISASGTDVIVYREAYMNVAQVTATAATFYNATGYYPDILIPTVDPYYGQTTNAWPFTVSAGQNQSAWVDVHIPSNAPSGYYSGTVTVKSGTTTLATMPVVLAVWQWPSAGYMPSTSSLPTATGVGGQDMCNQAYGSYAACTAYPGASGSADRGETLSLVDMNVLMLDHRISATNPIYPAPTTNFSGLETYWEPLFDGTPANTHTILSGAQSTAIRGVNLNTYGSNWITEFQAKGWLSRLFSYSCDEPPNGCAWSAINTNAAILHGFTPLIPALVTVSLANATTNNVQNSIDTMVVLLSQMEPVNGSGLLRSTYDSWLAGSSGPTRRLWSYLSCSTSGTCTNGISGGSAYSYPNYDIDGKPSANRANEWMTYLHNQTGELYYDLTYCWTSSTCSSSWTSVYAFGENGAGALLYPGLSTNIGVETPVYLPSVRLKNWRDGMQDYEYLNVLAIHGKSALVATQVSSWITNSYTFETSGSGLTAARTALGTAMHQLTYGGGGVFTSGVVNTSERVQ